MERPIRVAIVGGGCAGITAAFELSRPEHRGRYAVTVYQQGWRLGGKGASGRGPHQRIEEHGLHVWMGFYDNAFRLLRECYAELGRDPRKCRLADWRDAFIPAPIIGVLDRTRRGWDPRLSHFPPAEGMPGDPVSEDDPFSVRAYFTRGVAMARILLSAAHLPREKREPRSDVRQNAERVKDGLSTPEVIADAITRLLKYGAVATVGAVIESLDLLQMLMGTAPRYYAGPATQALDTIVASARRLMEPLAAADDEMRWLWEITDLLLATLTGIARFGLLTDPRGFDAIDDYECSQWLRLNGASEQSLSSAMMRGMYDLAFSFEDGDVRRPSLAAGQAIRGALRMFFTYRGAMFWKMSAGMGDVVFAPYYEVLKRRGVKFEFFHRLRDVRLADAAKRRDGERPYVSALEFDVQATIAGGGEYRPLIDVDGLPCWPSSPDYSQLTDGERLEREGRQFESFWEERKAGGKTLEVTRDFDFVVVAVGLGAIPYVCRELIDSNQRWRDMVTHCKTTATQAFQIWMREDVEALGWPHSQVTLTAFTDPFDTWADMRHLIPEERWPTSPRAIAYFCAALPETQVDPARSDEIVKRNAIEFLNREVTQLWPRAGSIGKFRWDLLLDPDSTRLHPGDESVFDSQFWSANINPSDRYCLALPGTTRYRISPLDNTFDNLTVAGDWTSCGFNQGCVEAAVMSGRLASHAISSLPRLEDIVGYDHP